MRIVPSIIGVSGAGCAVVLINAVLIIGTFAGCMYAALWLLKHFGIVK